VITAKGRGTDDPELVSDAGGRYVWAPNPGDALRDGHCQNCGQRILRTVTAGGIDTGWLGVGDCLDGQQHQPGTQMIRRRDEKDDEF
jgi:hypothetical protein